MVFNRESIHTLVLNVISTLGFFLFFSLIRKLTFMRDQPLRDSVTHLLVWNLGSEFTEGVYFNLFTFEC